MKNHNAVSLETVNMLKGVISLVAKRKKASIVKVLEQYLTALLQSSEEILPFL